MNIRKIQEEFLSGVKGRLHPKKYVEVFVNPTNYEMEEVAKDGPRQEIRFFADGRNKKVYIFSNEEIHSTVLQGLGLAGYDYKTAFTPKKQLLTGVAQKVNNKWTMTGSDAIGSLLYSASSKEGTENWERDYLHMLFNTDWSWANKWIEVDEELNNFKKEYKAKSGINESLYRTAKVENRYTGDISNIEIFENPSKMEMEKAQKHNTLRFTAFAKTQKIYVFSPEVLHPDVFNKTGIDVESDYTSNNPVISGMIEKRQGSTIWHFTRCDQLQKALEEKYYTFLKAVYNSNWEFLEKYFEFNFEWSNLFHRMENVLDHEAPTIKNKIENLTKKKK